MDTGTLQTRTAKWWENYVSKKRTGIHIMKEGRWVGGWGGVDDN